MSVYSDMESELLKSDDEEEAVPKIDLTSAKIEMRASRQRGRKGKSTNLLSTAKNDQQSNSKQMKPADTKHSEVVSLLKVIKSQCDSTKNELSSVKNSIAGKFKEVDCQLESHSVKIKSIEKKISSIQTNLDVDKYDRELDKQQKLKNNVVIFGVPKAEGENVNGTALIVFKAFECKFTSTDLAMVYRSGSNSSTIIVKFADFKNKLLALEAKTKKPITLNDVAKCDGQQGDRPIFINNHVTPYFAKILSIGRDAAKSKIIQSCWMGSTGCLVKINDDDQPKIVRSAAEMNTILSSKGAIKSKKRSKPDHINDSSQGEAKKRQQ